MTHRGNSPIAVIVELVVAGVRHMSPEPGTDGEEDLNRCIDPHLQRFVTYCYLAGPTDRILLTGVYD